VALPIEPPATSEQGPSWSSGMQGVTKTSRELNRRISGGIKRLRASTSSNVAWDAAPP
jgi:hypothetical protein